MFDFCRGNLLIIVATVLIGCADNSHRMDLKVGLFFAKNTKHLKVVHSEGEVQVGEDVVSTLIRATQGIFTSVEELESDPTQEFIANGQLNLAVVVQLGAMHGGASYQGNGLLNQSEARRTISVELICYNPEMVEIAVIKASGRGNASAQGIVFSSERRARVKSAKSAIRNLGDDVARQMSTNPEIRKMAE